MSSNRRASRAGRILRTIACSWQSIPFKSVQDVAVSSCLKTFFAFKYSMLRVFNATVWLKGFLWPQGSRDTYFCEDERHRKALYIILLAHCTYAGIVFFRKCFSLQYPVLLSWSHSCLQKMTILFQNEKYWNVEVQCSLILLWCWLSCLPPQERLFSCKVAQFISVFISTVSIFISGNSFWGE